MSWRRQASTISASRLPSSMVPVGLAGLAMTRPATPSRAAASSIWRAVGIQREAASVASRTGHLAERGQDMPVAGIAGRRQRHLGAGIEQRQERQHEAGRRPRRHHHPLGRDVDAIALAIVAGDAGAQRGQPQGHRVAQRLAVERPLDGVERRARCGRARLAHLHVDDLVPLRLARRGGLHHVHDDERRHGAALRGSQADGRALARASRRGLHGRTPIAASPQTAMVPPYPAASACSLARRARAPSHRNVDWRVQGTRLIVGAVRVA